MRTKAKRSTHELASLLLTIGQAALDAVEASGLLVRPKAKRKTTTKRKRRTKAEMQAARSAAKPARPKKAKAEKPQDPTDHPRRRDDIEDDD